MPRILVIEDEQPLLEEIASTLQFEGFDVLTAENGLQGVQVAQREIPLDLIVCDIAMPEMDGYNVLLELRNNPQTIMIPFMFLTARADKSFMRHGMELGADDYLTKPFSRSELLAAVRARLKRRTALTDSFSQELEQAKSSLARMVVHELRTPLVSVQMAKDIIQRQLSRMTPGSMQDMLETMGLGIDRLNHVVEQMVYLTQIETGLLNRKDILENGQVTPLSTIISSSVALARRFALRKQTGSIQMDMMDSEALVTVHSQSLKHALAEVIANALDFTPLTEDVGIHQWQTNGRVFVTVLDYGKGMSFQDQEKLLQRFSQPERDTQEQQGMGLGLFVAQQIVEAHGGALTLRSVPDRGTQIEINLPAACN